KIIGKQAPAIELSGTAAQNRFNLLFQKFTQVFTSAEHPLVMFLDDLQWADSASLKLIQLLMADTNYLLLIGAYRDNEVDPGHPLILTLSEIQKNQATINTITLAPLSQVKVNQLVADTLKCPENLALTLSQLVSQKTQGNPFFATQFLKALHQENLIQFDFDSGFWQCDIAQVITLAVTDDVVAFMGFQLRKLPPSTQQALQLAACIGNQFDLATLAIVSEKSEVDTAADLWKALQEGLILPISDVYKFYLSQETLAHPSENQETVTYKFLHDRVQQAAYSLIPEEQKNATHLKIGQLLQQNSSELELEEKLFDIVNHLNMGQSLITPVVERNALAQLNLAAGRKAKLATAYSAAIAYFTTGMELLPPDAWQSHYELTLALHESTAEVAYLIGQFEQMEAIANLTLQHAKTLLDKITTYETQIQASVSQNRSVESVQIALHVLKQLGIQLPKTPTLPQTLLGLAKTKLILGRKNPSDLLNLPTMSHPEKLAAMRILTSATNAAFFSSPALFPLLIFQQVNLSVQYGNTPLSAYAYACYGTLLCGALIDIDGGYKFGQLALQVLEKFNARYLQAKVLFITNITILYWKQHLRSTLLGLQKSYQVGLETGDLEYAANSAAVRGENLYWSGQELSDLAQTLRYYTEVMSQLKQDNVLIFINIYHQVVLNLTGESPNPSSLDGSVYSEAQNRSQEAIDNQTGVFYYYLNQTCLSYLFGEFAQAVKQADIVKQYLVRGTSLANNIPFHLYDSLARLALYPTATKVQQKQILRRVTQNQKKLQKWAGFAPMNLVHKLHLIEAERYRVLGQLAQAQEMYDRAIAGAKENQYLNEEALANELAAKFYLAWGKEKIAQVYMHDAYYCYARWGAKAKVDHLEKCYPQLLTSVLDRENTELSRRSMKTSIQPTETIAYTSRGNPSLLDLSTIMKASQAIAGEIELEKLLSTLMQVVLVNAGAQKGTLILSKNGNLLIAAQASRQTDAEELNWNSLQLIPLESSSETPHSLIYYAARTQETLVFDDVTVDPQFAQDNYIKTQQPKSVLCLPIINQGKLIGLLYLENNLMKGAFTGDRLEVLKLLATQSAISLENAQLYHSLEESNQTLEQKVTQRTQELHDKNQSLRETIQALKQAQLRLIQTEKMSSLGQMVAGIAHEINNPISFISGNLGHADSYTQDLIDLVETCQQELPSLNNKVQSKFQEIDIDFIKQDLKKIFGSMQNGSARIRNLILSLRNFARLDESEVKLVNIHEGIDNTLVLLQHRLNARSDDPAIKVIKDYGNLPLISCYASQLNQVFMNVLINAIDSLESHYVIDALEESLVTSNKSEQSKTKPLQIHIYTELINNQWISIRIVDNGVGMTEKVQQQIFNPFFTTKPVGSGTGLGLSISYQIIVDMHKGNLICNSTLGKGTEFTIQIPLKAM
ncbi:ATP-binding protein, partial [Nostoc sp. UCD120]|uniref:trifunctional serine/threonine-protein kinase/ATP-binding protein/sensor histidine kinase n=1 Tax=Nostoc sp. UCD120 TaxID=2681312 RepID=UPI001625CF41